MNSNNLTRSFGKNVVSPDQFSDWQKETLAFYRETIGIDESHAPLPLNTVITESIRIGSNVTRHRIEYSTTDGLRIPAFLFVPETEQPVPAIIVYHGHGDGKINSAEREGTNENALAMYLAKTLGYVTLAPDSRTLGEFAIPGSATHIDYYTKLISDNRLFIAKLMEDGYQDMALLHSLPEADAERIGVAGISMGSWRALNHSALHEAVHAVVVAGLFLPWEYLFSEAHCRCQHIPALAREMSAEDLAATIFPRHLMIQWGQADKYYRMCAEDLIDRTAKIAEFLGIPDRFTVDRHSDMGHRFSNPEVAAFFLKRFGEGARPPK